MQGLGLFPQGQCEIPTGAHCLMGVTLGRKHLRSFKNTQLSGYLTNLSFYFLTTRSWFLGAGSCRFHSPLLSALCVLSVLFSFSSLEQSLWGPKDRANPQVSGCTVNLLLKEKWDSYFSCLWQQLGMGRNSVYLNKNRRCITYLSFAGQLFSDHATPWQVSENLLFF